jgi:hypothetical protein
MAASDVRNDAHGEYPTEEGAGRNRRRNPRIPLELPVVFQFEDGPLRMGRTVNYSDSGVFVATPSTPPKGSWGVLRLKVASEMFDVEALVVRVVLAGDEVGEPGFGAEFVALPRGVKSSIMQLVGSATAPG